MSMTEEEVTPIDLGDVLERPEQLTGFPVHVVNAETLEHLIEAVREAEPDTDLHEHTVDGQGCVVRAYEEDGKQVLSLLVPGPRRGVLEALSIFSVNNEQPRGERHADHRFHQGVSHPLDLAQQHRVVRAAVGFAKRHEQSAAA